MITRGNIRVFCPMAHSVENFKVDGLVTAEDVPTSSAGSLQSTDYLAVHFFYSVHVVMNRTTI